MNRGAFVLAAAAAQAAAVVPALAQSEPLTLAVGANDAAAQPFYAQDLGYFAGASLKPTIEVLANGSAIIAGVVSGAIDIGSSNVVTAATAFSKGLPLRLIAGASLYDGSVPQLALLVARDSPVRTAIDLEGKTIAVNGIGGIGNLATNLWMVKHGADPATVKWLETPPDAMAEALIRGRVDAAAMTEPFITPNRATTRSIGDPYTAVAPTFLTVGWVASAQWCADHPDAIRRFVAVMRRAAVWANANQAKSGAILATYSHLDPSLVGAMLRVKYAETLTDSAVQPNIDLAARYKLIAAPFAADAMIYRSAR